MENDWNEYKVTPPEEDHDFHEYDVTPPQTKGFLERLSEKASPLLEGGNDLAQYLGQKAQDFTASGLEGLTGGFADEISAGLQTGGELINEAIGSPFGDTEQPGTPTERYRRNQQLLQKELENVHERSPYAAGAGQLAGSVTTGGAVLGALGGGASAAPSIAEIAVNQGKLKALGQLGLRAGKTALSSVPVGMVEGAATSKKGGLLSEEERSKLLEDANTGGAVAAALGGTLHGTAELVGPSVKKNISEPLSKFMENSPLLRQMGIRRQYGLEGINPGAQSETLSTSLEKTGLSELDNTRTKALMDEILVADKKVGQAVGQSLENATVKGIKVDINSDTRDALGQLITLADKYPEISNNSRAKQIYQRIVQSGKKDSFNNVNVQAGNNSLVPLDNELIANKTITPVEAKELIDYMDAYIGKFKAATNKTPLEEGILSNLYTARKQFSTTLKQQVPEYSQAAERMTEFRNLVPETIIAGNRPVDVVDQYYGSMNHQDQKLFDPLKKLIQGTTAEGTASIPTREAFVQSMKGMKTFEQQDAARLAAGKISEPAFNRPISDIETMIKKHSDDAVARGATQAAMPTTGVSKTVTDAITGTGGTGHTVALRAAGLAGSAERAIAKNPVAKLSRDIFNAPNEAISALAQKLKSSPNVAKYGDQLEHALQSTDTNKRNQVLFTIMQNPSARSVVDENTEPQE